MRNLLGYTGGGESYKEMKNSQVSKINLKHITWSWSAIPKHTSWSFAEMASINLVPLQSLKAQLLKTHRKLLLNYLLFLWLRIKDLMLLSNFMPFSLSLFAKKSPCLLRYYVEFCCSFIMWYILYVNMFISSHFIIYYIFVLNRDETDLHFFLLCHNKLFSILCYSFHPF